MRGILKIGKKAPDFCLHDQDSEQVCLNDLKGKWVVLYFYPKDDTPGCTIEAKSFSKETPGFEDINAVILGISADDCGSHKKFAEKYGLNIRLLSDQEKKVLKKYGVWGKKVFMGRKFMGIKRTTYLINSESRISYIWENVNPEGHAIEVKAKLLELQEDKKWQ